LTVKLFSDGDKKFVCKEWNSLSNNMSERDKVDNVKYRVVGNNG